MLNFYSKASHLALGCTGWLGQSQFPACLCVGPVTVICDWACAVIAQQCPTHCSAGLAQHPGLCSHSVTPENEAIFNLMTFP